MMVARRSRGLTADHVVGPDPIDVEVGLNLRRARLRRGLSQTALGDMLGISFQQIQKYERGFNRMSASTLVKAAQSLRIGSTDLLPSDERASPIADLAPRFSEVPGVADLINAYCALPTPELRGALLQLARSMRPKAASSLKTA